MNPHHAPVVLPEPRPVEWPPPSAAEVLKRARIAADEVLAAAEAEAAKLRTESAALRTEAEVETADAERRAQLAVAEHGRLTDQLGEELKAKREAVRLNEERAEQVAAEAAEMLAAARAEAASITESARDEAGRLRAELAQLQESAGEREQTKARRDKKIDDWSPRVALTAVVGLTASGEFALAQLAGWPQAIAWLLPLGIDVYVVQALRRHRDVSAALILMVAANAIYHLAAAGLFGVRDGRPEWWLIVGVAAIAPFVMWRLHKIVEPPRERRKAHDGERPEVSVEALTEVGFERADERHDQRRKALTGRPAERVSERPDERLEGAQSERSVSAGGERRDAQGGRPDERRRERRERAQKKPKASVRRTLTERRRERVRRLYDELGKRPEWTDIRDVLVADKLAAKDISRSSCQRVRDAIESDEPALAALGSDNARVITAG
ncbi:hypothetical protein [Streptomyces sp. URMC 124]|uniref:hypothetical protein n=1 Tax=Streptomyces sp. URMC 124 TaxID=3423405 RepID=UPI003F199DDF